MSDKSQRDKKWQPAYLQLSVPIFTSYEGGDWVIILLTGVSGRECCYNLFYIMLGYQFLQFPEISDHQKGHSTFKVFYCNVVYLCFRTSLITFWMCSPDIDQQLSNKRCSQIIHMYCPNVTRVKSCCYYCRALHLIAVACPVSDERYITAIENLVEMNTFPLTSTIQH